MFGMVRKTELGSKLSVAELQGASPVEIMISASGL